MAHQSLFLRLAGTHVSDFKAGASLLMSQSRVAVTMVLRDGVLHWGSHVYKQGCICSIIILSCVIIVTPLSLEIIRIISNNFTESLLLKMHARAAGTLIPTNLFPNSCIALLSGSHSPLGGITLHACGNIVGQKHSCCHHHFIITVLVIFIFVIPMVIFIVVIINVIIVTLHYVFVSPSSSLPLPSL